jgi:CRISPR-associated endonuclease/helicase Cas3
VPASESSTSPSPVTPDPRLWGKLDGPAGRYSLLNHMLDTSAAAFELWNLWLRPGLRALITEALAPGDERTARGLYAAVAGMHDVGKVTKVFQGQLLNPRAAAAASDVAADLAAAGYDMATPTPAGHSVIPESYERILRRHEAGSLYAAHGSWPAGSDRVAAPWAATVVGGHHGRFHPRYGGDRKPADRATADRYLSQLSEVEWGLQQQAHIDAVLTAAGVTREQLERPASGQRATAAIMLVTGLVMLADWLSSADASVADGGTLAIDSSVDPSGWTAGRREHFAATIPTTLGIYADPERPLEAIMGEHADSLSPLQTAARDIGRGLWIATETTGAGKTEAAMLRHAAVPGEGIFFALPTRATTNAMHDRMRGFFSGTPNASSLLHAHRTLNPFYSAAVADGGLHVTSWLTDSRNALFAPVAVGTCDQVLLGSLRQKNTPVRLLALANRHVVIDEVHAFDAYQGALLEEMLAWWGETDTRVTLLSASVPKVTSERYARAYAGRDVEVEPVYPGHITVTASGAVSAAVESQRSYDLEVTVHTTTADKLVHAHVSRALAYRKASTDARIAVVVNQVDRAIAVGRAIAATGHRVIVLHSRMAAGHRAAVTRQLLEVAGKGSTDRGVIVVGTQMIEASLDLDFDHMISDLAPAPSLIQRGGRLWRSTAVREGVWAEHRFTRPTGRPVLDVIAVQTPSGAVDAGASLPYMPGELTRTLTALSDLTAAVRIPDDVQTLVDAAAFDPFAEVDEATDVQELTAATKRLRSAGQAIVPMHHKHQLNGRVLDRGTDFRGLSAVTEPNELAEHSTRHIDRPTVDAFIVAPDGPSQWVWRGDTATALNTRDTNLQRTVLGLTFPIAGSKITAANGLEVIPGFDLDDEVTARRRGPMQRQLVPVRLIEGGRYDDLLGLRLGSR